MPKHIYWTTICKNPACQSIYLAHYVGFLDELQSLTLPWEADKAFRHRCQICGKTHTYAVSDFSPAPGAEPPALDYVPWS
jgi:hypothetical protein